MSGGEWFVLAFGLPATLVLGWVQSYRTWRHQADVGSGMKWITGPGGQPGYHAFLLPGTVSFTMVWLGLVGNEIRAGLGNHAPKWLDLSVTCLLVGGVAAALVGFWLWVFMWPRFLVPAHLRAKSRGAGAEAKTSPLEE